MAGMSRKIGDRIAIRKLRTIINDPNLLLMFAMEE